jgi:hypothetical protein
VLQSCDVGSATGPSAVASDRQAAFPAAGSTVLAARRRRGRGADAWCAPRSRGQSGTGAFMTLARRRARASSRDDAGGRHRRGPRDEDGKATSCACAPSPAASICRRARRWSSSPAAITSC